MDLQMDFTRAEEYKSRSQMARVVTESWVTASLYCAACTSNSLTAAPNNARAVDFTCPRCDAPYQLKGGAKWNQQRVTDAGYDAMIQAIQKDATPHLLVMQYTPSWQVRNLLLIPRFFFTASAILKRKPLGPNARRAGWVGCHILLTAIADEGKLPLIQNGVPEPAEIVRERYEKVKPIADLPVELRGWALDLFSCVSRLGKQTFTLSEVYDFEDHLSKLHPENRNIRPKIRQQLQFLRDAGLVEFTGRGNYTLTSR